MLLRFAEQLAAAGNSAAAFDVASTAASQASGDMHDRARLLAARAALWAGALDDAEAQLDRASRSAASSSPAVAVKEALEYLARGAVAGMDARQSTLHEIESLLPASMSPTDRDLLTAVQEAISASIRGDLRESDAAAARLRLSTGSTPPTWPWTTGRAAPSPLAEVHVAGLTVAFELRAHQLESGWDTLMDAAQRLPVELLATGIVASLARLMGTQLGRETWVAGAIEALAPNPPLSYDPGIPATSDLSGAVSRSERRRNGAMAVGPPADRMLSRRERQVADLVRLGFSNRTVADELGISPRTVEVHLSSIYKKL